MSDSVLQILIESEILSSIKTVPYSNPNVKAKVIDKFNFLLNLMDVLKIDRSTDDYIRVDTYKKLISSTYSLSEEDVIIINKIHKKYAA